MIFEEWELNVIVDSLKSTNNLMTDGIVYKIRGLQSQSKNKRYTFRSTDWLSEAGRKRKKKIKRAEEDSLL